jgi:hypothetical protein
MSGGSALTRFRQLGYIFHGYWSTRDTYEVELYDSDTRGTIQVILPDPDRWENPEDDPDGLAPMIHAAGVLRKHMDAGRIPPDTVAIRVDETGHLLSCSANPAEDITTVTNYLPLEAYQLPPTTAKPLLRSELTELVRFCGPADLVKSSERLPSLAADREDNNCSVFKYWDCGLCHMWHEVQLLARLPPHPNMALLDRLVVDELTGSQLVGVTMRYVASQDLSQLRQPFKLKWLRQLMQAVDDLNLKHGVLHQDIASRNLIIDPDTDSIVVIDFGHASRIGKVPQGGSSNYEQERDGRDDGTPNPA